MSPLRRVLLLLAAAIARARRRRRRAGPRPRRRGPRVEVVVTLDAPRRCTAASLASACRRRRVARDARPSFLARGCTRTIPGATVRWRYRTVLDGFAVVVPPRELPRLARCPASQTVYPSVRYHPQLEREPAGDRRARRSGARRSRPPATAMKIAIIDDGVDQTHPFFDPAGYTMPAGFPKGQTAVHDGEGDRRPRRSRPPAPTSKYAARPFDPEQLVPRDARRRDRRRQPRHTRGASAATVTVSGVAPRAYIGNYKALTIPTPGFGLDGNSPEIAAAIEAAVNDGMDVINLSLGEPEVEPSRDIVVQALEGAAAAGVVPVVAAGNDFEDFGRGSVGSPGSTPDAITVAASTEEPA